MHKSIKLFSSLRFRLVLILVLVMAPGLALTLYTTWQDHVDEANDAKESSLRLVRLACANQEGLIQSTRSLLVALSHLTSVRKLEPDVCSRLLADVVKGHPIYANLGVIRSNGQLFCSTVPVNDPVDLGDRAYFRRAVETRDFSIGDYQVGRITKKPSINFGYPVLDEAGQVKAVVFAAMDLGWLHQLVAQAQLPPGSTLTVLDRHGTILARYPDSETWTGKSTARAGLIQTILQQHGEGVAQARGVDGTRRFYAFAPLQGVSRDRAVYVSIGTPAAVAFAEAHRILIRSIVGLSLVGVLATFLAWLGSELFLWRRVRAQVGATQRLAAGDLGVRMGDTYGRDELGQLARAFDEMASALQNRTTDLSEAEAHYRVLVEKAQDVVFTLAADGTITSLNPAFETITGWPRGEWLGKPFSPIIHPEDLPLALQMLQCVLQRETPPIFELRVRSRSETYLVVQFSASAQLQDEQVVGVLGIARDITAQKQTEQSLRESEELFRSLSVSSPLGIFLTDIDGRCIYSNPRCRAILGFGLIEGMGEGWTRSAHADDREGVLREWTEYIHEGKEYSREFRLQPSQGTIRWVHIRASRMLSDQGARKGHVATVEDITERKRAEETQRASQRELEKALEELRKTQQQVIQQERLRALGQMASGIAHDFNNALAPVLGYTELLLDRPESRTDDAKATHFLKVMNTAARDAANIVRRLREFYRYRENTESFLPVDLKALAGAAIALTRPRWKDQASASGAQVEVTADLHPVPAVVGNAPELREVLTNLVFNAVDAMPRGGSITVRTRRENEHAVLEICDTGVGMSEEVRRRCFEPFFTTKGDRGTGLGLAMVHGIIRRHEGSIEVQSEPGTGTTFSIRLPISSQVQASAAGQAEEAVARPSRILLVEDEPIVRDIMAEYLKGDGHLVETAGTGREGLQKFRTGRFELVVTDMAMPEMNGEQLATIIKQVAPRLPVILLTGFGDVMRATGDRPAGIDHVVSKPVTLIELRQAVARALAA